jgi:hypothetical protein
MITASPGPRRYRLPSGRLEVDERLGEGPSSERGWKLGELYVLRGDVDIAMCRAIEATGSVGHPSFVIVSVEDTGPAMARWAFRRLAFDSPAVTVVSVPRHEVLGEAFRALRAGLVGRGGLIVLDHPLVDYDVGLPTRSQRQAFAWDRLRGALGARVCIVLSRGPVRDVGQGLFSRAHAVVQEEEGEVVRCKVKGKSGSRRCGLR